MIVVDTPYFDEPLNYVTYWVDKSIQEMEE